MGEKAGAAPMAAPAGNNADFIKLRVIRYDTAKKQEVHFRMKPGANMGRLKKAFADSTGESVTYLRFLFDEFIVNNNDTPKTLDMVNEDVIGVYLEKPSCSRS